jgi:CHAT domain-containing protein/Flp pilus assembly protein TadD
MSGNGPVAARIVQHIEACEECRAAATQWEESLALFASVCADEGTVPSMDCPPMELLLGARHDAALLEHAATCDFCGPILKDLSLAGELRTGSAKWQRGLASQLAHQVTGQTRRQWIPGWVGIAAAVVVAASGLFWWSYERSSRPEALLARACTTSRPFEYRLPDAGYAVEDTRRGGGSSNFDKPPDLLRAEEEIRRKLAARPDDARLLVLKGLAELEERDYESAIDTLTHASDLAPPDARALTALGCAYSMRGDIEKRNIDYGHALDLLLKAVRQAPDYRAALFNLAIVYEKLSLLDEAAAAWQKFLKLPDAGGWSAEARTRLENVEKIRRARKQREGAILEDPGLFLKAASAGFEPERYSIVFWTKWLPTLATNEQARRASELLGVEMQRRNGDRSIRDAVAAVHSGTSSLPFAQLAQVILDVRAGRSDEAPPLAQSALPVLEREGQFAAAMRLRAEIAYIDGVQTRLSDCLRDSEQGLVSLRGVPYPWIAGQLHLQHAGCVEAEGMSAQARAEMASTARDLQDRGLQDLRLRAVGFLAILDAFAGNQEAVWQNAPAGLEAYWNSAASDFRAQQIEIDLQKSALALNWDDASSALYEAAIRSAARAGDRLMEAVDRMDHAGVLRAIGDHAGETRELDEAERLFRLLPRGPGTESRLWFGRLRRAESEIDGDPQLALAALNAVALNPVGMLDKERVSLDQARGKTYFAQSNWTAAADSFRRAIAGQAAASPAVLDSYRGLAQVQLIQNDAPGAFDTWQASRLNFHNARPASDGFDLLVAFALLPRGVAVFSRNGSGCRARMVSAPSADVERMGRRFVRLCSSPSSSPTELRDAGGQLYRWLLAPELESMPAGSRILLQADGWTASLPFDALTTNDGTYLGRRFVTEELEGRFTAGSGTEEKFDATSQALVVSAPSARAPGGTRLPLLSAAQAEGDDVSATLPHATLLRDESATPEALRAAIPHASIFHFAGHGWSDGGDGALILASDAQGDPRFLTAREISTEDWSGCKLAFLSACLTAAGELHGPINNQSLVRALLTAGTERVVAAKWSIGSEATRELVKQFYRELVQGRPVAAALNRAEFKVADEDQWRHPYYWAGFAVFDR